VKTTRGGQSGGGAGRGTLVVENPAEEVAGTVSWLPIPHGPNPPSVALNVGIRLRPAFRGRGLGGAAQAFLAVYLFGTTTFERLQAETDVTDVAEQRALEKAGFQREGIARHAQFREGSCGRCAAAATTVCCSVAPAAPGKPALMPEAGFAARSVNRWLSGRRALLW
jgi:RimJ/RimL family protein N-acetyltransferase